MPKKWTVPKKWRSHRPAEVYGVYDTQSNLWIGDSKGPHAFRDLRVNNTIMPGRMLAQVCAQAQGRRAGVGPVRYRVRRLPKAVYTKKDTIPAKMNGEQAIKDIEAGKM